jgi:hypothetical protein
MHAVSAYLAALSHRHMLHPESMQGWEDMGINLGHADRYFLWLGFSRAGGGVVCRSWKARLNLPTLLEVWQVPNSTGLNPRM